MKEDNLKNSHILIVDDQPANIQFLERLLEMAGYTNFLSTTDPRASTAVYSLSFSRT